MKIKQWCAGVLIVALCSSFAGVACGMEFIVNGDFEDTTGWVDPDITTYPVTQPGTPPADWDSNPYNPAEQQNDPTIGGGASARMPLKYDTWPGSSLSQGFLETGPSWQLDLDFASEDPGTASHRCISGTLKSGRGASYLGVITFRVNGDGDFQLYDGTPSGDGWASTADDALAAAVIFDTDVEVTDPPLTHHLTVTGNFDKADPDYDITITDSDSVVHTLTGLQLWNYGVDGKGTGPAPYDGLRNFGVTTGVSGMTATAGVDYLLDNVSVTADERIVILGDADLDSDVDADDKAILEANWLTYVPEAVNRWGEGDFNDDKRVDDIDATIMATNWGRHAYLPAANVPEQDRIGLGEKDIRAFGAAFDIQDEAYRYFIGARYLNSVNGDIKRQWQYMQAADVTDEDWAYGCQGEWNKRGIDPMWYGRRQADGQADGFSFVPGGKQHLCYNESDDKINWMYLRLTFDLATREYVELQSGARVFDLRGTKPTLVKPYAGIQGLLNPVIWVETDTNRRVFLYIDSVVVSCE